MTLEKPKNEIKLEPCGVQGVKIENDHYVVSVIWKDGKKSELHFPQKSFPIIDLKTHQKLGYIPGEKAVSILKENSPKYNQEDFSWTMFLNK